MTDSPDFPPPLPPPAPPVPPAGAAPQVVQFSADLSRIEHVLAQVSGELIRDRRSARRWRLFGRVAWFALVVAVVWGLVAQRGHVNAPSGPHTALIEVRGEIAADSPASAENIVSALKSAFDEKN